MHGEFIDGKKKRKLIIDTWTQTHNKTLTTRLTIYFLATIRATRRLAVGVVVLLKLKETDPNQGISSSQADLTNQTHVNLSHTRSTNRAREPNTRCSRGNFSKRTFFTLRVRGVGTVVFIRPTVAVLLVVGDREVDRRHSGSRLLSVECPLCVVLVVFGSSVGYDGS
jgi:hypothetical protein